MPLVRRWPAQLVAICAFLALPTLARADARADLEAMSRLMRDLRYEEAVSRGLHALREARPEDAPSLPNVYRLLGTAYFLLGDEPRARTAWVQLFALDAEARPPEDVSPKLRAHFARVRLDAAAIALDPASLKEVPEGKPILMEARLAGTAGRVDRVLVHFRVEGAGAYTTRRLDRANGVLRASLPAVLLVDGAERAFEYWLEARDAQSYPLAMVGTEAAPLRARVIPQRREEPIAAAPTPAEPPRPAPPAFYQKWWFWGAVGGLVAAAAGTGLYFGMTGAGGDNTISNQSPGLDVCIGFKNAPCPMR